MTRKLYPSSTNAKLLLDSAIILVGLFVAVGFIDFSPTNFWLPWLLALAGVFIASVPAVFARQIGIITSLVGVYLILRYADIISAPLLGYGLGIFLIIVGTVNLVRDAQGGSVPSNKTLTD